MKQEKPYGHAFSHFYPWLNSFEMMISGIGGPLTMFVQHLLALIKHEKAVKPISPHLDRK